MTAVLHWLDRAIGKVISIAKWLVLPIALLLLVQWPLREIVQSYSREANDVGQLLFALYVAIALTCASRRDAHLATDVFAHRHSSRVRSALVRGGLVLALLPWTLYVLVTSASTVWRSVVALETFPDTYNPGYFMVKLAVSVLAGLLLLQVLVRIFPSAPTERGE
jgi:TRAP-type mannitol/chloroaromatic compound transport system permease small subunit